MPLLISNDVTARVLTMKDAIAVTDSAFQQYARGLATFQTRTDMWSPTARDGDYYRWGSLLGAICDPPTLALRFKSDVLTWKEYNGAVTEEWHAVTPGRYLGFILLIDTANGELIGMLNDGIIQHVRVGALTGVGVRHLARKDSSVVGMLGSGGMAKAYLEAICIERPIRQCRVFSPTPANRERFAREMGQQLGIEVTAVDSKEAALRGADIATLCTDSRVPIFTANMVGLLKPGALIVNVRHDEIDGETYDACDRVVITCNSKLNDFVLGTPEQRARRPMDKHYRRRYVDTTFEELSPILIGAAPSRKTDGELIFFHNISAGIQFAAVGRLVYDKARERGLGTPLPIDWFLQDMRN
jgi:ornithine cyclodeaminase/alanine dehydrogenase-like protein (mu-crystallin family)